MKSIYKGGFLMSKFIENMSKEERKEMSKSSGEVEKLTPQEEKERMEDLQEIINNPVV